jgi:hypothetical protein
MMTPQAYRAPGGTHIGERPPNADQGNSQQNALAYTPLPRPIGVAARALSTDR